MQTVKVLKHFHKDYAVNKDYNIDDETAKSWIDSGLAAATNLEELVEDMQDQLSTSEAMVDETAKAVQVAVEKAIANKSNKIEAPANVKVKDNGKSFGEYLQLQGKVAFGQKYNNFDLVRRSRDILNNKYATDFMSHKATNVEGTAGSGGNLVPYDFIPELLYLDGYDPLWRKAKVVNTRSDLLKVPVLNQTVAPANNYDTAFAGGMVLGVVSENTAPSPFTNFAVQQLSLPILKVLGITQVSTELLEDSPISVEQIVTNGYQQAFNAWADGNMLNGTGGSTNMTGIIGGAATLTTARETAMEFSLVDAASMIAQLNPSSRNTARWVMSPSAYAQLLTFKDAAGRIVFWSGLSVTGAPAATLFGLSVQISEHSPTLGQPGDVLLVDTSKYVIGLRSDVSLMTSIEYAFNLDVITYRFRARLNGIPQITAPVTLSNGVDQVSYAVELGDAIS